MFDHRQQLGGNSFFIEGGKTRGPRKKNARIKARCSKDSIWELNPPSNSYCYFVLDSVEIHDDRENGNLEAVTLETLPEPSPGPGPPQRSSIVFDIDEDDYLVSYITGCHLYYMCCYWLIVGAL